jgi:hypothetical protein
MMSSTQEKEILVVSPRGATLGEIKPFSDTNPGGVQCD